MAWPLEQFRSWALSQGQVGKYDDGQYPGQCVSLINQYCYRVLDVPAKAWGHAKEWASNAAPLAHFDKVSSVQAGDILVYPATSNNAYGHIEIALGHGQALGQNRHFDYRIRQAAQLGGYIAVLRKKGTSQGGDMEDIITDTHKYLMRVMNTEVKGWNFHEVHSGKLDDRELKAWRGKKLSMFSQQAWDEGAWYRALKDKWKAAFDAQPGLLKKISDLEKKASDLERQLTDAKKQPAASSSSEAEAKLKTIKDAATVLVTELGIK